MCVASIKLEVKIKTFLSTFRIFCLVVYGTVSQIIHNWVKKGIRNLLNPLCPPVQIKTLTALFSICVLSIEEPGLPRSDKRRAKLSSTNYLKYPEKTSAWSIRKIKQQLLQYDHLHKEAKIFPPSWTKKNYAQQGLGSSKECSEYLREPLIAVISLRISSHWLR